MTNTNKLCIQCCITAATSRDNVSDTCNLNVMHDGKVYVVCLNTQLGCNVIRNEFTTVTACKMASSFTEQITWSLNYLISIYIGFPLHAIKKEENSENVYCNINCSQT